MAGMEANSRETSTKTKETVWQIAVETWMQNQGRVTVSLNGKLLPPIFRFVCHN